MAALLGSQGFPHSRSEQVLESWSLGVLVSLGMTRLGTSPSPNLAA